MISSVRPLYTGNALQVTVEPPTGAKLWRVLRKAADNFTGETDPQALIAYEGNGDTTFVDAEPGLPNEIPVYYRAYYFSGSAWTPSASASGTPLATYGDNSTDAQSFVRNRLEAGFGVEIVRQTFELQGDQTVMSVLTAPPMAEAVSMPAVTVYLKSERPGERALGEEIGGDTFGDTDGKWTQREGWEADVELEIVIWSLNPDQRIEMRKALRRLLIANLSIFDAAGMTGIEFSMNDVDAISGEYSVNIYQVMCDFSCKAPIIITEKIDPITDVIVNVSGEYPQTN